MYTANMVHAISLSMNVVRIKRHFVYKLLCFIPPLRRAIRRETSAKSINGWRSGFCVKLKQICLVAMGTCVNMVISPSTLTHMPIPWARHSFFRELYRKLNKMNDHHGYTAGNTTLFLYTYQKPIWKCDKYH